MKKTLAVFLATLTAAASLLLPQGAVAQPAPIEGKQYLTLAKPQPTVGAGKIEAIEFFWYGCIHCNAFAPTIKAWAARQKSDVVIKHVPVAFSNDYLPHSKIYYALEALGKVDAMHQKVFNAIFVDRKRMVDTKEIADFMAANGIDRKAFLDAYQSFNVSRKASQAQDMVSAYDIQGTPTVIIQGKYVTSPSIAGDATAATQTMDWLVTQVRNRKK